MEEIAAREPLLLLRRDFGTRQLFDAACRLAHIEPRVVLESREPHSLVTLAEAGHGVAIVPSTVRFRSTPVRTSRAPTGPGRRCGRLQLAANVRRDGGHGQSAFLGQAHGAPQVRPATDQADAPPAQIANQHAELGDLLARVDRPRHLRDRDVGNSICSHSAAVSLARFLTSR